MELFLKVVIVEKGHPNDKRQGSIEIAVMDIFFEKVFHGMCKNKGKEVEHTVGLKKMSAVFLTGNIFADGLRGGLKLSLFAPIKDQYIIRNYQELLKRVKSLINF